MRRPSFQFYPADWRSNANLRRCTHRERGIWIDVLCLLHDSEEYGVLRWPLSEIAEAVGCKQSELFALTQKGVLKGSDRRCEAFVFTPRHAGKDGDPVTLVPSQKGPVWYSSRMVKDEYVRSKRGEGSRFGVEPKGAPKPPIGDGASSSSSSSSSNKEKERTLASEQKQDEALRRGSRGHVQAEPTRLGDLLPRRIHA